MIYRALQTIGFSCAFLALISAIFVFGCFLLYNIILSIIEWVVIIPSIERNVVIYIIVVVVMILLTLGVLLYIIGIVIEFIFRKYPSLLLEKKDYELNDEEKERISVIIPAYNEEKSIKKAIESVNKYCKNVVVVDDGSVDKTSKIASENGAIVVRHKMNMGLGHSLKDGILKALSLDSKIIINFDADLQYNGDDIPKLVYYLLIEDYDLVMGSRFAGKIESMSLFKKFGNRIYTKLLCFITKKGISDGQTGFRAFTAEFSEKIHIRGDYTYTQEMILEAVASKAKIGEIPINFAKREDGKSRLMKNPFHFAKLSGTFLVKVLIDLSPVKVFTIISSLMIIFGLYIGGKEILNWIIYMQLNNTYMVILASIFITGAIIIISIALLISSLKDSQKRK